MVYIFANIKIKNKHSVTECQNISKHFNKVHNSSDKWTLLKDSKCREWRQNFKHILTNSQHMTPIFVFPQLHKLNFPCNINRNLWKVKYTEPCVSVCQRTRNQPAFLGPKPSIMFPKPLCDLTLVCKPLMVWDQKSRSLMALPNAGNDCYIFHAL